MSANSSVDWWRRPEPVPVVDHPARAMRGNRLCHWALIGFTVILLLAPQEQFPVLAPFRIALLSATVAVLACGYYRLRQKLPLLEFSPEVVLVLLLVCWSMLTVVFSYWPGGSVSLLTDRFLKAVVCFLLLSHAISNLRQLQAICWCLVLCTVPLTLTTLVNYASGITMGAVDSRVIGYASGLTQNPNDMALMLNLILPLCFALALGARGRLARLLLAGISLLIVLAVIATFSRAGFLTLAFIGVCYAWLVRHRPQRIWIPVVLLLGALALPLVPDSYFDRISTIVTIEDDQTNSAQTRLSDMKVATEVAFSRPVVGSGIGMSALALNEARGERWLDVHNVYLQVAVDLGLPGLLLYVLLMWRCLRVTGDVIHGRSGHAAEPRQLVLLAEALRVSLLAFAVSAMFYPVAYHFYFFFFAGLAIAAGKLARDTFEASR